MDRAGIAKVATLAAAMLLLLADGAAADEFYYVLIFGSQPRPKQLRYTHTWATFVKATGTGTDPNAYQVEQNTISWLPATLDVRVWDLIPEEGVNLGLHETIAAEFGHGDRVVMWGPFLVQRELYERSLRVSDILASGRARYRAISTPRNLLVSDCIHAVAAVDPVFGRGHYPLIRIGIPASRFIAREVMTRSVFDQAAYDNSWLIPRLGLDRYPIEVVPPRAIPKEPCVLCTREP